MQDKIIVKGARVHNLKNIDVEIPRNKLVVITGLSGSGKSSLAFDTIYAEGQRRYVESLSAYARQFLGQMDKPDVDSIEGLSPAISIDQKSTSHNPRSTVGTVTEIYDYLRLLYARIGKPHCPKCGQPVAKQTVDQMVDRLMELEEGTKIQLLAPVVRAKKGQHASVLEKIRKDGYVRVRINGQVFLLDEEIKLEKNKKHTIEIVVDRLVMKKGIEKRLADSLETALKASDGVVLVDIVGDKEIIFSEKFACVNCNIDLPDIEPRSFSFNSPFGACPVCTGLGVRKEIDVDLIIPDKNKSIREGAIEGWVRTLDSNSFNILEAVADFYGFSLDVPVKDMNEEDLKCILYGTGGQQISVEYIDSYGRTRRYFTVFEGIVNILSRWYMETASEYRRKQLEQYVIEKPCSVCSGTRLRKEALSVLIGGKNIFELSDMTVVKLHEFLTNLALTEREQFIARQVLKEINDRLMFLVNVGLDYLTLNRAASTLSGGEAQRIRLATQIGSGLTGVLYVLDEPSIGLHQRDNSRLIETLKRLRDLGNSLIVVEHDEDTILSADYVIDIGPAAGENGGKVVAAGTPQQIADNPNSITGQYLSGKKFIPIPEKRRKWNLFIKIMGASENNLKNIDVAIPLGVFTCVTGVSGSGKSTLINEVLYKYLAKHLNKSRVRAGKCRKITGIEHINKVIVIDQSPIGRTPRSNPATYTGVFTYIRELFARMPESRARGYKPGRFSFNVKGGRCEACQGDGIIKIEMHFLPDVYVPCEVCKGRRYNRETLEIRYKGKNIADVLDMTVDAAADFFQNIPSIYKKLKTLQDVGLGYIRLGQSAPKLSGGEAQRVKLATELSKTGKANTSGIMYILDEPTTGLHADDINRLLKVLHRLVDSGNTVVVIEHNLDVIKTADYIIDLGPEGGDKGGEVIAAGTPEEIIKVEKSYTSQYLRKVLEK
ncbi:excinuclease ABC subunit UvrA [Peptococcaceae bacterium]|nr:excinuclease ABC subunit UvrA [Peptococcaceae bacterium]